jgi:peroxiredoxin Q/BCP
MKITRVLIILSVSLSARFAAAMAVGDMAPNLSSKNQSGKIVKFSEFKGKYLLVYFYPADETPGCTKEACDLRDSYTKIKALNTEVLGVSRQGSESHKKFIANHKLPFDLLVDESGDITKAFGVETMPVVGYAHRESFLFDSNGKLRKIYHDVDASKHAEQVLADIQDLQKQPKK